ncbi:MAG: hypothetical protein ACYDHN_14360 [Solirubrobacteraceae bacterium]
MDTQESIAGARAWLAQGRRRLWAAGAAVAVAVVAVLSLLPAGGGVSVAKMQELVDTAYRTTGTRCVTAAHGRDLCHVKAERCEGTLLVAPTSGGHFTTVSSTPEQLDSAACNRSEEGVGGFE